MCMQYVSCEAGFLTLNVGDMYCGSKGWQNLNLVRK